MQIALHIDTIMYWQNGTKRWHRWRCPSIVCTMCGVRRLLDKTERSAHHYSNNLFVNRKLSFNLRCQNTPIKCHRSHHNNWLETISPFNFVVDFFFLSFCFHVFLSSFRFVTENVVHRNIIMNSRHISSYRSLNISDANVKILKSKIQVAIIRPRTV